MITGVNCQAEIPAETGTSQSIMMKLIADKNRAEITVLDIDTVQTESDRYEWGCDGCSVDTPFVAD